MLRESPSGDLFGLSQKAFESVEKVVALNLQTAFLSPPMAMAAATTNRSFSSLLNVISKERPCIGSSTRADQITASTFKSLPKFRGVVMHQPGAATKKKQNNAPPETHFASSAARNLPTPLCSLAYPIPAE